MKLAYWGTAAAEGIPAIFCNCPICTQARRLGGKDIRTRAQMLIDDRLLVDFGPDTYAHAVQYGASLVDVSNILITHSHSDHFYGEDLVFRAEPYGYGGKEHPVTLHTNERTQQLLQQVLQVYNDTSSFDHCVKLHTMQAFQAFDADGYTITPLPAMHDRAEACFIFDILSLQDGKRMLYGNDTSFFPAETIAYMQGRRYDLLSLDCTQGADEENQSHMTLPMCIKLVARLREQGSVDEPTRLVVTHFSHNARLLHHQLCAMAEKEGFAVAYDGMTITL